MVELYTVTRVLLVEDQRLVRAGFRSILDGGPDLDVVGEAGDGAEAVRLAREPRPDVVLMDVRMPELDGLEATRRIVADARLADVRVIILTTTTSTRRCAAARAASWSRTPSLPS